MSTNTFHLRDASSPEDAAFIVAAFDSSVQHLAATGNSGQWGTQPFSEKDGFLQETRDDVVRSEKFRQTGQGERMRIFIAEVEDPVVEDGLARRTDGRGRGFVSVGMLTVRDDDFAQHVFSQPDLAPVAAKEKEKGSFVWVDVIITDFRAGQLRKCAGVALVEKTKQYARENGKKTIFLDCWTGGTGRLIQYYEGLGFKHVLDYEFNRKDGSVWPGRLVRMDLPSDR